MGCWQETCAVTKTPIFEKQPVFMIVPKPDNVIPHNGSLIFRYQDDLQSFHYGTYDEYGWIKEVDEHEYCKKYNDERPDRRSVFVHKHVMDKIITLIPPKTLLRLPWETSPALEHEGHFMSLVGFALDCRLDLNGGIYFKGCQHEPKYHDELIAMMQEYKRK